MLAGVLGFTLFMRFGGLQVRSGGFDVVCSCFVVIVFRHYCS